MGFWNNIITRKNTKANADVKDPTTTRMYWVRREMEHRRKAGRLYYDTEAEAEEAHRPTREPRHVHFNPDIATIPRQEDMSFARPQTANSPWMWSQPSRRYYNQSTETPRSCMKATPQEFRTKLTEEEMKQRQFMDVRDETTTTGQGKGKNNKKKTVAFGGVLSNNGSTSSLHTTGPARERRKQQREQEKSKKQQQQQKKNPQPFPPSSWRPPTPPRASSPRPQTQQPNKRNGMLFSPAWTPTAQETATPVTARFSGKTGPKSRKKPTDSSRKRAKSGTTNTTGASKTKAKRNKNDTPAPLNAPFPIPPRKYSLLDDLAALGNNKAAENSLAAHKRPTPPAAFTLAGEQLRTRGAQGRDAQKGERKEHERDVRNGLYRP